MNRNATTFLLACVASVLCPLQGTSQAPATGTSAVAPREQAIRAAMKSAAQFYHDKISTQGGYLYYYATDLQQRWGEGEATADQIWVQQPGTPAVGPRIPAGMDGHQRSLLSHRGDRRSTRIGERPTRVRWLDSLHRFCSEWKERRSISENAGRPSRSFVSR